MQIFKDNANRDWTISLNIGTAMMVKDRLGIDLLQPETGDPPLLTRLGTDEMLLAQVIAALLESQFEFHKVDAHQIYQCFDGQTFARAHEAFYKELIDFFQSRGRHDRSKAVEKQRNMILAGVKAAETKIENINIGEVIETAMNGAISGA
ncbi:MAG: hypothetical protein LBT46_12355 [Planctomycetaceae bacterium]|jgi:hypothetical protein|nr:hypothetical protein [Planctomycetaceae bacterium]